MAGACAAPPPSFPFFRCEQSCSLSTLKTKMMCWMCCESLFENRMRNGRSFMGSLYTFRSFLQRRPKHGFTRESFKTKKTWSPNVPKCPGCSLRRTFRRDVLTWPQLHTNLIWLSSSLAEVIVVIKLERSKEHLRRWDMRKCDFARAGVLRLSGPLEAGGPH